MSDKSNRKTLLIVPTWGAVSETFFRAHAEYLPGDIEVLYDFENFNTLHFRQSSLSRHCFALKKVIGTMVQKFGEHILGRNWKTNLHNDALIRKINPDVILFEYGTTATRFIPFLKKYPIPFVVHFHGFDASVEEVIQSNFPGYLWLLKHAHAIVAVSRQMRQTIISWGCPENRVFYNPCGVEEIMFSYSYEYKHSPNFIAIGRFVEKKAPHLLICAFAKVLQEVPESRLTMVGDGSLLSVAESLAKGLGITEKIDFIGLCNHEEVCKMMSQSGCFVQHSVRAKSGDSEGTPVSVMEALAMGLPVVATAHAGIRDIIEHEKTGLLVEEFDIDGMAQQMLRIIREPDLAIRLGKNAKEYAIQNLTMTKSIETLSNILEVVS